MFGIDGEDFDAAAAGFGDEEGTGDDEGFFVGQGEGFTGLNGGEDGREPGGADDGGEDDIDVVALDQFNGPGGSAEDFGAQAAGFLADDAVGRFVGDGDDFGFEMPDLFDEFFGLFVGAEGDDFVGSAEMLDDVQRVGADGTGGTEDGDSFAQGKQLYLATVYRQGLVQGR